MRRTLRLVPTLALVLYSTSALAAETLPLKRVVMTTSGLALYEHGGTISGDAAIDLSVRLDSVDDVLKSLTVLDNQGAIAGVSLPGREPLSQSFRDLPFTQEDLTSLPGLINALRGAEVQISSGSQVVSGRLVSVMPETVQTKDGIVTRHRVALSTHEGIKTFLVEDLSTMKFTDPVVQGQIDRALESIFSSRIKDRRSVRVALKGQGERPVTLGYIQAAPLWKSGYRLVLPAETAANKDKPETQNSPKAVLQGWAVLENTTGADWKDVQVTLTSGSPVTYTQPLYESYYLARPELPVKVMNRVLPRVDRGTVAPADRRLEEKIEGGNEYQQRGDTGSAGKMRLKQQEMAGNTYGMAIPQESMSYEAMASDSMAVAGAPPMPGVMAAPAQVSPTEMAGAVQAVSEDAGGQMIFAFPEPVTLTAGNTLMVPFISETFPAERLWVYQPETNPLHPLAAVALENAGKSGLPPGILTLYDRSGAGGGLVHVGDAEMPLTPKGERRFIPFALDSDTRIDRNVEDNRHLGLISVSKGVLRQKAVWLNTTVYTVKAPVEEARTIIIEHPRLPEWELVKPEGIMGEPEVTATHYRLRLGVAAGQSATLKVVLRREDQETFALVDIGPEDLRARVAAAGKDLPANLRKALEKVGALRADVYAVDIALQRIANERQNIATDQQRMRENLQSVGVTSGVGKRYLDKMQDQEDRLAALEEEEKDLQEKRVEAQQALEQFIASIDM